MKLLPMLSRNERPRFRSMLDSATVSLSRNCHLGNLGPDIDEDNVVEIFKTLFRTPNRPQHFEGCGEAGWQRVPVSTKALILVSALALASCTGAQPSKFIGPDGRDAYSTSCFRTLISCYKAAAKKCHGKYEIIDPGTTAVSPGGVQRNNIIFSCK